MTLVLTFIPWCFAPWSYILAMDLPTFTIFIAYLFRIPLVAIIRAMEINFVQLNELLAVPKGLVFTDVVTFGIYCSITVYCSYSR